MVGDVGKLPEVSLPWFPGRNGLWGPRDSPLVGGWDKTTSGVGWAMMGRSVGPLGDWKQRLSQVFYCRTGDETVTFDFEVHKPSESLHFAYLHPWQRVACVFTGSACWIFEVG